MSNPWLKKNPLMSMWLSAANRIAGTMRGQATAQAKRQISAAVTKATNDNLKAVLGGTEPASPKAKPKRRR
ncbi:hypothetical protein [Aromatoleum diolicum]|uniref:Uncharacterized protein n=1 Tax=Aromatoleum diolicum TaxID=75796 RepID=A0ABX1QCX5_9RHOO|nr:hypothetical protein [Aromatoleum diolicum]NMG76252.1 hypothetical protein [Aromatoleum diolicum]